MSFNKSILFENYKNKCHLRKFLLSWVSELWIYLLILHLFTFNFFLYLQYMCESGSVYGKLLNTDPIRIQIHNTA